MVCTALKQSFLVGERKLTRYRKFMQLTRLRKLTKLPDSSPLIPTPRLFKWFMTTGREDNFCDVIMSVASMS